MLISHCFDYFGIRINQELWCFQLYFSFARLFGYSRSLAIPHEFWDGLSVSVKKKKQKTKKHCEDFNRDWIECVHCFG